MTSPRYPVEAIHEIGNPKKKLDLVFLPEGYTSGEMDKFMEDCHRFADYLFETEPYCDYQKDINIRAVLAPSPRIGTDIPGDTLFVETLLNSNFYTFGSDRYLTTADFKKVRNVASNALTTRSSSWSTIPGTVAAASITSMPSQRSMIRIPDLYSPMNSVIPLPDWEMNTATIRLSL